MTRAKQLEMHCWRTKLEALEEQFEAERPGQPFVGSPEWRATLHKDWRDGVCRKAKDHLENCEFEDIGGEKANRKAS